MPRIPLEDNFTDIIGKAQRGLGLSNEQLAAKSGVSPPDLEAIQGGEIRDHPLRAVAAALKLSADALLAIARREYYPEQMVFPRGFALFNTTFEDMTVNSYLVWDSRSRVAAAFDTGADCSGMLDVISTEKLRLQYVFLTHTHDDHIADLARLAQGGAEVWASDREPANFPGAKTFAENAHFHLGDEIAIKTLSTWGHSPGLTTFFVTGLSWPLAIVGDSLFAGSMGGSRDHYKDQWRNTREKIFKLPSDTVLACGHGPLTTLKQERHHNPFFAKSALQP